MSEDKSSDTFRAARRAMAWAFYWLLIAGILAWAAFEGDHAVLGCIVGGIGAAIAAWFLNQARTLLIWARFESLYARAGGDLALPFIPPPSSHASPANARPGPSGAQGCGENQRN